ncbi:hypothetical protein R1flu_020125 [Riccia fluitans]|uniref:Large ribosomal subunit protein uL22c n=1 Tax=Riccia fluitans TaxID=41844 RepID=A0ABD1ZLS5_9MARC
MFQHLVHPFTVCEQQPTDYGGWRLQVTCEHGYDRGRDLTTLFRGLEANPRTFTVIGGIAARQQFHDFQRRYGISTSAYRGEAEEPVRSPLSQAPGPLQGSTGGKLGVSDLKTAQAVLTGIRMSPQKLNMMAEMVRGMRVDDALNQMAVSVKRAAKTVTKVVHSAQANAVHNYGLNRDRLVVTEAFVGKDKYLKRFKPHGKGKAGKMERARSRLTVIVKEMSQETEADLARLKLFRKAGTRMSRSEARLVPHRLLETQWKRQRTTAEVAAA